MRAIFQPWFGVPQLLRVAEPAEILREAVRSRRDNRLEGWEGIMAGPDSRGRSKAAARHLVQAAAASWIEEPVHFEPKGARLAVRSAFISDTHLGTSGCNAELLLDFLKSVDCE